MNNFFSPDDFKKWVEEHKEQFNSKLSKKFILSGIMVESKVNIRKLISSIDVQEGDVKLISKDFLRNGGMVKEVDGCDILIEVKNGIFVISEKLIRIQ
jgi:hypothetical protein